MLNKDEGMTLLLLACFYETVSRINYEVLNFLTNCEISFITEYCHQNDIVISKRALNRITDQSTST
jgi:hypothetical protein